MIGEIERPPEEKKKHKKRQHSERKQVRPARLCSKRIIIDNEGQKYEIHVPAQLQCFLSNMRPGGVIIISK